MLGFLTKIFGGSKSEKDVKSIEPTVASINQHFSSYQSISNDELRGKTLHFKAQITKHLEAIDAEIAEVSKKAEDLPISEMNERDILYQQIDKLKKTATHR